MTVADDNDPHAEIYTASYIHGIPEIASNTSFRRYFWLITFLIALSIGMYSCWEIFRRFYNEDTVTEMKVEAKNEMILPQISICPFARFQPNSITKHIDEHPVFGKDAQFVRNILSSLFLGTHTFAYMDVFTTARALRENFTQVLDLARQMDQLLLKKNNWKLTQFLGEITYKCEDIVLSCSIDMQPPMSIKDCCSNFGRFFNPVGYCPVIKGLNQQFSGILSGLKVELRVSPQTTSRKEYFVVENDGFFMSLLHPSPQFTTEYFHVMPQTHASIYIREIHQKRLNVKGSPCVHGAESQQYCLSRCVAEEPFRISALKNEKCGKCRGILALNYTALPNQQGLPECNMEDSLDCFVKPAIDHGLLAKNDSFMVACQQNRCVIPCEERHFEKTLAYSKLSGKINADGVRTNLTNMVVIDMTYSALQIETVREILVMDALSMVANIGGTLGLWIGASMVSMVQLITLSIKYCKLRRGKEE